MQLDLSGDEQLRLPFQGVGPAYSHHCHRSLLDTEMRLAVTHLECCWCLGDKWHVLHAGSPGISEMLLLPVGEERMRKMPAARGSAEPFQEQPSPWDHQSILWASSVGFCVWGTKGLGKSRIKWRFALVFSVVDSEATQKYTGFLLHLLGAVLLQKILKGWVTNTRIACLGLLENTRITSYKESLLCKWAANASSLFLHCYNPGTASLKLWSMLKYCLRSVPAGWAAGRCWTLATNVLSHATFPKTWMPLSHSPKLDKLVTSSENDL